MTIRRRCRAAAATDPGPREPRLAFGVHELADALGVSRHLVKHMIRTGQRPSVKRRRCRLISRKALERFLRRMRTGTRQPQPAESDLQACRPPGARRTSHDR
jgi:excisionase family DNA binding protein